MIIWRRISTIKFIVTIFFHHITLSILLFHKNYIPTDLSQVLNTDMNSYCILYNTIIKERLCKERLLLCSVKRLISNSFSGVILLFLFYGWETLNLQGNERLSDGRRVRLW